MTITSRGSPDQVSDPGLTAGADWFPANREQTLGLWQVSACPLKNVAGTNTITADADIAPLDAYAKGQGWTLIPANTNSGAVTVNIDGKGARALKRSDGSALSAGDIVAGVAYVLRDDGTNLRVVAPLGAPGPAPVQTYLAITYEQPTNTNGGTATSGARQTYPFNLTSLNTIASATFNTGTHQASLPAGTYKVEAAAAFGGATGASALYLRNTTDAADIAIDRQQGTNGPASLAGIFTLAATKTLEFEYSVKTTETTTGLGAAVNDVGTATEQYGWARITKVS
jgi:hypothetical protein